ncbi:MAG: CPBP family intramembrane glutamic endopeptidase [Opitutaceae bacterium]|jgi:hypothetical protein
MPLAPLALSAIAVEAALILAGLVLLWRFCLSPAARSSRAPSPLPQWNTNVFQIVFLAWLVLVGGVLIQIGSLYLIDSFCLNGAARQVIAGASFQLGMLIGCLGFVIYTDVGKQYSRPRRGFLLPGIVCFCISLPLVFSVGSAWGGILNLMGIPASRQDLLELLRDTRSLPLIAIMVGLAIVVAPVAEELVFRAGFFRFLRNHAPRWIALLVPSILFGALHGNLASFPQLVMLGIVFSIAYERTSNIAVPMLAHALFNLNTVVLLFTGIDA